MKTCSKAPFRSLFLFLRLSPTSAGVNRIRKMEKVSTLTRVKGSLGNESLVDWKFRRIARQSGCYEEKEGKFSDESFFSAIMCKIIVIRLRCLRQHCYSYQGWLNYWTHSPRGNPFVMPRVPVLRELCVACLNSDSAAGRMAHDVGIIWVISRKKHGKNCISVFFHAFTLFRFLKVGCCNEFIISGVDFHQNVNAGPDSTYEAYQSRLHCWDQ